MPGSRTPLLPAPQFAVEVAQPQEVAPARPHTQEYAPTPASTDDSKPAAMNELSPAVERHSASADKSAGDPFLDDPVQED
jgi:hypothetical protein